jgi:hypothetical protein
LTLSISNQTTLVVTLIVNEQIVGIYPPAAHRDPITAPLLPPPRWHVEARSPSGRVLASMDVRPGDVVSTTPDAAGRSSSRGKGDRAELSCGRLDIWSGPPLLGPAPPDSFPVGDCDP